MKSRQICQSQRDLEYFAWYEIAANMSIPAGLRIFRLLWFAATSRICACPEMRHKYRVFVYVLVGSSNSDTRMMCIVTTKLPSRGSSLARWCKLKLCLAFQVLAIGDHVTFQECLVHSATRSCKVNLESPSGFPIAANSTITCKQYLLVLACPGKGQTSRGWFIVSWSKALPNRGNDAISKSSVLLNHTFYITSSWKPLWSIVQSRNRVKLDKIKGAKR